MKVWENYRGSSQMMEGAATDLAACDIRDAHFDVERVIHDNDVKTLDSFSEVFLWVDESLDIGHASTNVYKAIGKQGSDHPELKSTKLQKHVQEKFAMLCHTAAHKSDKLVPDTHHELSQRDVEGPAITVTVRCTIPIIILPGNHNYIMPNPCTNPRPTY